jgi:AraC-like DNA-binding protein
MLVNAKLGTDHLLPFTLHTVGYCEKQSPINRTKAPGWHQFIWVGCGTGSFFVDEKELVIKTGEGIFLRGSSPHAYCKNGGDDKDFYTKWYTFYCDDSLLDYVMGDKSYLVFKVPDFLDPEIEQIQALAGGDGTTLSLSAASYTLTCELFEAITKQKGDRVILAVKDYLSKHFSSPVTLDEVAAEVGMDRYSLCRYFKKNHKRSVMDELLKIRISKAKRMLRYTGDSIAVISRACGFESPCYFTKRFGEQVGRSPSEYREEYL